MCVFVVGVLLLVTLWIKRDNQVGDKGACDLGDGLESNAGLKRLYLVSCVFIIELVVCC